MKLLLVGLCGSNEDVRFMKLIHERLAARNHDCIVIMDVKETSLEQELEILLQQKMEPLQILQEKASRDVHVLTDVTRFGNALTDGFFCETPPSHAGTSYLAGLEAAGILRKQGWQAHKQRSPKRTNTRASRR
jgi:hypothetical protein